MEKVYLNFTFLSIVCSIEQPVLIHQLFSHLQLSQELKKVGQMIGGWMELCQKNLRKIAEETDTPAEDEPPAVRDKRIAGFFKRQP